MEYIDGIKVNDVPKLKEAGLDPVAVADLVCEVFSEMVFVHGVVHCDRTLFFFFEIILTNKRTLIFIICSTCWEYACGTFPIKQKQATACYFGPWTLQETGR
jgi:hypothetical protein